MSCYDEHLTFKEKKNQICRKSKLFVYTINSTLSALVITKIYNRTVFLYHLYNSVTSVMINYRNRPRFETVDTN